MSAMYKSIKNVNNKELINFGFRGDYLKEGFYKYFNNDKMSVAFHITGGWSYVNIKSILRFSMVNNLLLQAAKKLNWNRLKCSLFNSELIGLFEEDCGSYCNNIEDIGIYCPENSQFYSEEDVVKFIINKAKDLSLMNDLNVALQYTIKNRLFKPIGYYMIPAAAKICDREDLFTWSVDYFSREIEKKRIKDFFDIMSKL